MNRSLVLIVRIVSVGAAAILILAATWFSLVFQISILFMSRQIAIIVPVIIPAVLSVVLMTGYLWKLRHGFDGRGVTTSGRHVVFAALAYVVITALGVLVVQWVDWRLLWHSGHDLGAVIALTELVDSTLFLCAPLELGAAIILWLSMRLTKDGGYRLIVQPSTNG